MTKRTADLTTDPGKLDMGAELRSLIADRIENHERSLQRIIGASEIGTPCVRKLALKLSDVDPVPEQLDADDKWRATVGAAVHDWLAAMLRADNERLHRESEEFWSRGFEEHRGRAKTAVAKGAQCHPWCKPGSHVDRWVIEHRTPIGTIDGREIPGTLDVYDRHSKTMIDWKVPGPTAIKKYRSQKDPGPEYRTQVQLYGRGLSRIAGEDVQYVGIMFLPSNGELKTAFYWEEPFDPEVGKEALRRARELLRFVQEEQAADGDDSVFRRLKTTDDHCSHCPFFSPGSNNPVECPGDPSLTANMEDSFTDLLPHGLPGA